MMKILDQHIFFAADNQWAGNPNIIRHSTGRLILGFRMNPTGGRLSHDWDSALCPVWMTGSTPEELAAQSPRMLVDRPSTLTPAFFELPGGAVLAWHNQWAEYWYGSPDGERVLKDPANEPFLTFQGKDPRLLGLDATDVHDTFGILQPIKVLRSDDRGETYRDWGAIYHDNKAKCGGCGFRGNMLQLDTDTIGLALNDGRLVVSHDEGRTWESRGRIGPTCGETSLYRKPDGEIVAFIRGDTRTLHIARSKDDGRIWLPTADTGIIGLNPYNVIRHSSGKVLLMWGRREAPCGIKAKALCPDLSDLLTAPEAWVDEYREPTSSGGYPAAAELKDGTCLVVYYARSKPYGVYEIHGRRIEINGM